VPDACGEAKAIEPTSDAVALRCQAVQLADRLLGSLRTLDRLLTLDLEPLRALGEGWTRGDHFFVDVAEAKSLTRRCSWPTKRCSA
jgi:hypothetical protein